MSRTVHLGFTVGDGEPVELPLRHLAVTGQTQEAGKTTTLEALIQRSGLRAVTFVTKRGEGSFANARRHEPYFREQADWQFVASILEASRGEKLKFERAWIIRASKGARTLADVQRNVRAALDKAKGLSADVYLTLDAYLDVVVPQIAKVHWAPALSLTAGVNAIDLADVSVEMQHLVIRSVITWVLERERDTVVVVPEAWKFIPQGRGTPVKLAAESFIRQGAALKNFLWLDSQDLGGIDKAILRSVPVWLLGVQREANEIKRTLDNIPAGTQKPKPADIAMLRLGEFFACWGAHVLKTYVQPTWLDETAARVVAMRGTLPPPEPKSRSQERRFAAQTKPKEETPDMCTEHQKLTVEIENLRNSLADAQRNGMRLARELGEAKAGTDLVRALRAVLGGETGGAVVDEESIVQRVLARVPAGGGAPIQVMAPEALRLQVQKDVAERLIAEVRALPPIAKRILKVMIAADKRMSQRAAAERAGCGWGGNVIAAYKALTDAELIDAHPSNGTKAGVRERIAALLMDLGAKDDSMEAVYQNVLHAIATGNEA